MDVLQGRMKRSFQSDFFSLVSEELYNHRVLLKLINQPLEFIIKFLEIVNNPIQCWWYGAFASFVHRNHSCHVPAEIIIHNFLPQTNIIPSNYDWLSIANFRSKIYSMQLFHPNFPWNLFLERFWLTLIFWAGAKLKISRKSNCTSNFPRPYYFTFSAGICLIEGVQ